MKLDGDLLIIEKKIWNIWDVLILGHLSDSIIKNLKESNGIETYKGAREFHLYGFPTICADLPK